MKKSLRILIICLFILSTLLFSANKVLGINLNTINNDDESALIGPTYDQVNHEDDDLDNSNDELEDTYNENDSVTSEPQVQVTTTQNKEQGLSFEGAATVILIAIGIVLIFLAIAILIKFK